MKVARIVPFWGMEGVTVEELRVEVRDVDSGY